MLFDYLVVFIPLKLAKIRSRDVYDFHVNFVAHILKPFLRTQHVLVKLDYQKTKSNYLTPYLLQRRWTNSTNEWDDQNIVLNRWPPLPFRHVFEMDTYRDIFRWNIWNVLVLIFSGRCINGVFICDLGDDWQELCSHGLKTRQQRWAEGEKIWCRSRSRHQEFARSDD